MAEHKGAPGLLRIAELIGRTPEQIRGAGRRGKKKAADKAKVLASRLIREDVLLSKAYVDGKLWIAWRGEDITLNANRRGVLLTRYDHRQLYKGGRKAGYGVRIHKGEGTLRFRHVFRVPMRKGLEDGKASGDGGNGTGLVERVSKARYPLRALHAPSVSQELEWNMEALSKQMEPVLAAEVQGELQRLVR